TTDVTTTTESTTGDEGSSLLGDVNLDGAVTLADNILLTKYIDGSVDLNAQALLNADCNSDNGVQATDAVSLLKFLVQLLDSMPE
ncbi:MAG: dockerin type I repeat-containing protein, partial [Ruminococcus sp.]|nr:dockerin type I repeat-containing protein [Ruminococcus sp.]